MAALAISCLMSLFFSLLSSSSLAQSYNNITLSDSLTAVDNGSSPWLSPSGDFAVGFRRIDGKDGFLLAIWFNKIPDRTIVWCANGDTPAQGGSKIQLTDSGLVLTDPQGKEIWSPNLIGTTGVSYAAMLDSGNLVIGSNNSAGYVWESFKNPTDTLLPTQTLEKGGIVSGRVRATNYVKGRFELRMLGDGNLVLNTKGWPTDARYKAYYISNTFGEGMRLVFNESGYVYIEKSIGDRFIFKLPSIDRSITDYYYRVTLDFDGVLAQYAHPRSSSNGVRQGWSTVWSFPDDICFEIFNIYEILGSGACGFNSYCELTTDRRPKCGCPPGYLPINPKDQFSGCRQKFIQGCREEDESRDPNDVFYFERVKGLDWPTGDYEKLEFSTQQECERSCLNDCFCALAVYRSNCVKKKLPFSNGRFQYLDNVTALIKLRRDASPENSPSNSGTRKKDQGRLISLPLFGSSVVVNFLLLAAISVIALLIFHKRIRKSKQGSSGSKTNVRVFTYEELEEATDGFKEELGRGSFGIVYKGFLALGVGNSVAVKKLDRLVQEGDKEFKAEVSAIGRTHHKNLVQLLGFCEEGQHRLLVLEFMSNGNLASLLFGISKPDWSKRIQFAVDIARGLTYLHEECSLQIIHCDIKPQNILLDDNFIARISDFGLAKLLMSNQTRTLTGIRGTRGYVAPEWFRNKPVTAKVDVYSYGVMLLEIICCRKSTLEFEQGEEEKAILTDWSYKCYYEGKLEKLVEDDQDALKDMGRVQRWVMIAIWCIQEDPSLRPTMKMVTQMLEGVVDVSLPPCPSFTRSLSNA